MSVPRPQRRRDPGPPRGAAWSVLAALAVALVLLVPASPATAHDALLGSDPADGAVLATPPDAVVLTFTGDLIAVGSAVTVTGPDGAVWADGAPVVSGATLTQPLLAGMPSGGYTVAWRAVSGDGHPIEGTVGFTVEAPVAGPAPTLAPEPTDPGTSTAEPTDEPTDEPPATPPPTDDGDIAGSPVGWMVGGVVAVALATAVLLVVRRRPGPG